jgi:hypothetical protein
MKLRGVRFLLFSCVVGVSSAQRNDYYHQGDDDYQDYAGDNLYADYASKQAAAGGGGGMGKALAFGAIGWFVGGKIHSKRAVNKVKKKHLADQKELYAQYYKDVLMLQTQNAELAQMVENCSKEQVDSQFYAADIDNDNLVSRAEFNMYKNQYLKKHPEMASQFPKFEQFDPDANGMISKAEYDAYYRSLGA